jgi:hypothetical protein
MHYRQEEKLRDLLDQRLRQVCDETLQPDGKISHEDLEALDRLARLLEISGIAQKVSPRKRWPLMVALGLTLLIVSILLFARVSQTEIELDLALSEASFVLPAQQMLTDVMHLSTLGMSGLQEIQLPGYPNRTHKTLHASEEGEQAIRLAIATEGVHRGTITLAATMLPAGTNVRLRTTDVPNQFRMSFKCPGLVIRAHVSGTIQVGWYGAPAQQIDFLRPTSLLLRLGTNEVDIDLTFTEATPGMLSRQLSTENLSFLRIEQFSEGGSMVVRQASTVLSGKVYFESLNGRERPLRSAEVLYLNTSKGQIRTLSLHDNHISLRFHGRVGGMTSGLGESQRSLMPTYLEYLQARHGLSLLWGTTLYLFGLLIGALRWWGVSI